MLSNLKIEVCGNTEADVHAKVNVQKTNIQEDITDFEIIFDDYVIVIGNDDIGYKAIQYYTIDYDKWE